MALGAEAHRPVRVEAGEVDRERQAIVDVGLARRDQRLLRMQRADQRVVGQRGAGPEADLRQARAAARQDGKGARADLGIERAVIALRHRVEFLGMVGDDAGEDVQPPGGALRIGGGRDALRQGERLLQRHDIDAAGFQHRAIGQCNPMQLQFLEPLGNRAALAGQEGGAHPAGPGPEPEIEAGRLDLVGIGGCCEPDPAGAAIVGNGLGRQDALVHALVHPVMWRIWP